MTECVKGHPEQASPAWFDAALAAVPTRGTVVVDGAQIAFRRWDGPGEHGVVLIHGGAAHSGWWDHIGPLLTPYGRVVALDLSGHGDSDWRPSYDVDTWAREVLAVSTAAGIRAHPTIVGHSMGGFIALHAAAAYGDRLTAAVVVDSPLRAATPEDDSTRRQRAGRQSRHYDSREAAVARFRPMPDQPSLPCVRRHVAAESVKQTAEGWRWKFDRRIFDRPRFTSDHVGAIACSIAVLRGEHGMLGVAESTALSRRLGGRLPIIEIPDAGHHIMLDQPLALAAALRTLAATWTPVATA
jgi:pimeloyl-ACP methyl ester carboxylesterase